MKRAAWILLALVALVWSGLAWVLHALAGAGSPAVVRLTRWLEMEPESTQWLADGLAMAGDIAQLLVLVGWAIGLAALLLVGWLAGRAVDAAETARRDRSQPSRGPAIDGEVSDRHIADSPASNDR
jgi:hypothetical protein